MHFAYWNTRGLAQPIRYLLEYVGVEYKEKRYPLGGPPNYGKEEWQKDKFNLGLDFPNLPYLIDGENKVTQSWAILRYLGRKYNLKGEEKDQPILDMLEGHLQDIRMRFSLTCISPDYEKNKENYLRTVLPGMLKALSSYLAEKPWLLGSKISYVDFFLYEMLDIHIYMEKDCLKDYPNLIKLKERFENLDEIKKYMSTDRYISYPLMGPTAKFGEIKK